MFHRLPAVLWQNVCAMSAMSKKMKNSGGLDEDLSFVICRGAKSSLENCPPFEFENWAVIRSGGVPNVAKVGDMGIDGRIYPVSATPKKKAGELDFMDVWYPIQVKQKDKVGRPDIDSFEAVMMREDRTKGFFVCFDFSSDAMHEIQAFFKKTGKDYSPNYRQRHSRRTNRLQIGMKAF